MNIRDLPQQWTGIYALDSRRPVSQQLPRAVRVRALSGSVWLTQEGLADDIVLQPGEHFETTQAGLVVMNAIHNVATVYVEPVEDARRQLLVTPELIAAVEAKARRLRHREIARLARYAGQAIRRAVSALSTRLT